jgi:hypothetical protein
MQANPKADRHGFEGKIRLEPNVRLRAAYRFEHLHQAS